jgi:hypothetical protein
VSVRWIRLRAGRRDSAVAALFAATLGLGVGAATFYVVRLLLAREPLDRADRDDGGT